MSNVELTRRVFNSCFRLHPSSLHFTLTPCASKDLLCCRGMKSLNIPSGSDSLCFWRTQNTRHGNSPTAHPPQSKQPNIEPLDLFTHRDRGVSGVHWMIRRMQHQDILHVNCGYTVELSNVARVLQFVRPQTHNTSHSQCIFHLAYSSGSTGFASDIFGSFESDRLILTKSCLHLPFPR
jgi:hypothetical protein